VPAANAAPIINVQPQSQPSYVGATVTFNVTAVSALPMTNQWYKGSTPLNGQTNPSLVLANLQLSDAGNYSVVVGNANGTTNSAVVALTVNTPRNLEWSANANSGVWDTSTSANWVNLANSQQTVFNPGDATLFDDTLGVPTSVAVSGVVYPSLVTVNSSANNFGFSGSGNLGGSGVLVKEGSSTLNITTPSGFTGSVIVGGGTIYAGNNCFSSAGSIVVSNNSTLDFAGGQFNNVTPVTVSGAGYNGQGALINTYADYPGEKLNVTLAGDTLFSGTARWDMASGSQFSGAHNLTLDWSAAGNYGQWNSVAIGASVVGVTVTNGSSLGFSGMDTSCQNPGTLFTIGANGQLVLYSGGFNGSVHLFSGATMYVYSANVTLGGSNLILEDGSSLQTYYNGGVNPVDNAVTLNGMVHFVLGDHTENFTNVISGTGGFVLDYYNNAMVLSASNTYSGPTSIGSDGNSVEVSLAGNGSISHSSVIFFQGSAATVTHMDVTGRSDQTLTLASGQTLAGVGAINGSLVVSPGATLSPSGTNTVNGNTSTNAVGAIAAANNVTLNGTTVLKLDGLANDTVQAAGNISYGGTLSLANISGTPLAAGNTFQLFTAGGLISGNFASIIPTTPGSGLAWNTSQLGSGVLSVMSSAAPVFTNIVVSGGNIIVSGSGGSAGGTFYVLTTTNLLTPLTNWVVLSTNSYNNGGYFSVTNPVTVGTPARFYRTKQ
jgi:fibronectin-binding autotransporter adhesin